jgi:hypothetical protein
MRCALQSALLTSAMFMQAAAFAAIRLADDWPSGFTPEGRLVPRDQYEPSRLRHAAEKLAESLKAPPPGPRGTASYGPGFKLFIDDVKYYIAPATFMAKSKPDEVCTPKDYDNIPTYQCVEGQRLTKHPHVLFFNDKFEPAGAYKLNLNLPYQYFCNTMPALGVADKARNELLVTVQCFNIDRTAARKPSELGDSWKRMTVLFRVKANDGKVVLEQDDTCLGNPNQIETIPDARKRIKRCSAITK